MTKNIVLAGGPEDGRTVCVPANQKVYIIVQPFKTNGFSVMLTSTQQGEYQQTGEYSGMNEIFTWNGWK